MRSARNLDFYYRHQIIHRLREVREVAKRDLRPQDLVGTWNGKESWGTTFVITRRADGTFSEITNFEHADVSHKPPIVSSEGCYFLAGSYYGYYYTRSDDSSWIGRPPVIFSLTSFTPTGLTYCADEGNPVEEHKQ